MAVVRRPAARLRVGVRRPAAALGEAAPQRPRRLLGDLSIPELSRLGAVWLKKAAYYHQEIDVAGKVLGVRVNEGQVFVDMEATGTEDEAFLRAVTGKEGRRVAVHICAPDCANVLTDEFLVHGREFEAVDLDKVPWYKNLVQVGPELAGEVDELARMREEAEKRVAEREGRPGDSPKAKKVKEKKDKKKEKDVVDTTSKKKKRSSEDSEDLVVGQKELSALYSKTALDPDPKQRRRVLKRARKLGRGGKKKKKRSTSSSKTTSSSSSSRSSGQYAHGGLFSSEKKMQLIWRRYPGALAASALIDAKEMLLTASGTMWDVDHKQLPPLATQFVRQQLAPGMSPAMLQEALTISCCIDNLLLGKPATACDVLFQRLKALENVSKGSHWSVGRQLELVRSDQSGLTNETEGLDAARRAREEERLRSVMTRPVGGRPAEGTNAPKGKKGKDSKGTGKGGSEENRRGKGGDGKKDTKGSWQKTDK